jgi:hypothetical protein
MSRTTGADFLIGSTAVLMSRYHIVMIAVCCCCGCGHVGNASARRFTVAFYRALGEGYSIREAFRDGGDAVVLDNKKDVFWSDGKLDERLVILAKS